MKNPVYSLPEEIREDYILRETGLFKSRVGLYCLVTTAIYFGVSLQYLFRKAVLQMDTFRPWELSLWVILLVGTVISYRLNRKSKTRTVSKTAALLYTGFFMWSFSGLAVVYPENISVFVFYYAFALLLTSSLIPWSISEVLWLTGLYAMGFLAAFDYVAYVINYPINSLPRFQQPFDGLVFITIASFIAVIVRRKEIERDVHNFALLKKIESQNIQIDRELDLARRVHKTLVPDSFEHPRADVWVSYIPMSYVSGDYAKFRFLGDDKLLVLISDVTGHGVAAALLVNRVHAEFERLIQETFEPAKLLKKLNDFIARDFEGTNMYLSAFCGLLDFNEQIFSYSSYGHPPQYFYHLRQQDVEYLGSQNTLLGISSEGGYGQGDVEFEPGDRLLLFTDGVIEAADSQGQAYGEARLLDFLRKYNYLTDGAFNEILIEDLRKFRNGSFTDDIFVLNVRTKNTVNSVTPERGNYVEENSRRR